jgi:hypothetical protein
MPPASINNSNIIYKETARYRRFLVASQWKTCLTV